MLLLLLDCEREEGMNREGAKEVKVIHK